METVETLEAAALHLPPGERARLIERLIASLDADPMAKGSKEWKIVHRTRLPNWWKSAPSTQEFPTSPANMITT
jgi:hypothetical protein